MSGSKEADKQYGLINMKNAKTSMKPLPKKLAIFDESDDEETPQSSINQKLLQEAVKTKMRKQTKMEIQKAMEEDPTVFEYDSIYDDMEQKKQERERMIKSKQRDSKPKYIGGLMKAANQRKMERERQKERKIQKEREKEGEEFGDKEQFVTASYKKKMQELAEDEERERREAERDGDVTKKLDLTGFYRHILEQTTGEAVKEEECKVEVKRENLEVVQPKTEEDDGNRRRQDRDNQARDKPSEDKDDRRDSKHRSGDHRRHRDERQREDERQRGEERQRGDERQRGVEKGHRREKTRDEDRESKKDSVRDYKRDRERDRNRKQRDSHRQDSDKERKRDNRDDRDRSTTEVRKEGKKDISKENKEGEERLRIKDGEVQSIVGGEERVAQEVNKNVEDNRDETEGETEEANPDADSDLDISEESEEEEEKGKDEDGKKIDKIEEKPTKEEKVQLKYAKRTTTDTVMSARDRYLARKMERDAAKSHIAVEEDD